MKKFCFVFILACMFMLTGCTKNYKTVSEYSADMTKVRQRLGDYTIEAVVTSRDADVYCKSRIKNNLWKTEVSHNGGKTYIEGILYDGSRLYSYSNQENIAMEIPLRQMFAKGGVKDAKMMDKTVKFMNPTGLVYNWDAIEATNIDKLWTFGERTKKNNYNCRMLTLSRGGEACISDKYGVAVYLKVSTPKKGDVEINVKKISNNSISNHDLELSSGLKKVSMTELISNKAKMINR